MIRPACGAKRNREHDAPATTVCRRDSVIVCDHFDEIVPKIAGHITKNVGP